VFISVLISCFLVLSINNSYSNEKKPDENSNIIRILGQFSIQNVYLSFLYISTIEYQIENKEDKESEIKLINSVYKLTEASITSLKQIQKNSKLNDEDSEILDEIIEANDLLVDEMDYLQDLINSNQKNIMDKVNKKHRKTWNSIKKLLDRKSDN
jgi:hypothetical protein